MAKHLHRSLNLCVHAILDFLYLAQLLSHSPHTLACMDNSLSCFHDNEDIFVELGFCTHFNISKIHSLINSILSIQLFGTTNNYNTEQISDFTLTKSRTLMKWPITRTNIIRWWHGWDPVGKCFFLGTQYLTFLLWLANNKTQANFETLYRHMISDVLMRMSVIFVNQCFTLQMG